MYHDNYNLLNKKKLFEKSKVHWDSKKKENQKKYGESQRKKFKKNAYLVKENRFKPGQKNYETN